ncbi:type II toxin-antitoxin system death-on-curing family toxin [Snodgrassella alvi]|uniref:type II toxin-antitoxin system death-on-curing family toxin n=1 Tax=Snodgrassella alvi TaxID=1196083 RepID=UPI00351CB4BA
MNSIAYITLEEAIAKHDEIILASGGLLGLRDEGLLISALTMIQNDFYYSEYHEKLTHLIFSINKNHCFIDGNKRASISLGASFLLNNGWSSEFVASFIMAMEEVVVWLANDEINKNDLNLIIECLFLKFGSSKDYVDAMIQELLTDFRNMVKDLSYLIQIDNDIITSLKKLNRINQIQIYKDEIIKSEEWIRKAQKEIKIWELILKFLQN